MNHLIKAFLNGKNNGYSMINLKQVEKILEDIIIKLESEQQLDLDEQKFLNLYMEDYYPSKVDLYPYPKYDEYLKPIHKRLAKYYLSNIDKNNYESVVYLQFYFLTDMCRDFQLKPRIKVGDTNFFEKDKDAMAYHSREYITGTDKVVPKIVYNPEAIKNAVQDKNILSLIIYGFHELEHELQTIQVETEELENPQTLLWAKEILLRSVIGKEFYTMNYKDVFLERDARNYAKKRIMKVLEEYGDLNKNNYIVDKFSYEDAHYDTSISFVDPRTGKITSSIELLDGVSTTYIKENPIVLNKYPILKNIYNENGSKKLLPQIQDELNKRRLNDISKNSNKKEEINDKYSKLLNEIIETDPELLIQSLCQEIYKLDSENKDTSDIFIKLNKSVNNLNLSYEDFMMKINSRLHELDKILKEKYISVDEELKSITLLKECMVKYIDNFKIKYNNENIILKYNKELKEKFGFTVGKYNYSFGDGFLVANNKSIDELDEDYFNNKEVIKEKKLSKEEEKDYLIKLKRIYDIFKQELPKNELNSMFEDIKNTDIIKNKKEL